MTTSGTPAGTVLLAAPRGYCAGVERAIEIVERALELYGPPVYVRKQIVHNQHVVAQLAGRGAVFVDELDECPDGATVIFSAHGVSPAVRGEAERRGLFTIDGTCPLVAKVHAEARRYAGSGHPILLIGHAGHEEVDGTVGEAPASTRVFDPAADPASLPDLEGRSPVWLSQTTLAVEEVEAAVAGLRSRYPDLHDPPSEDVCYASSNRQRAVKAIAPRCDLLLVVGSANSSNSVRLVEVALQHGTPAAYLIDDASGLRPEWFAGVGTVGLTAGASAPETLVSGVLAALAERGYAGVEEVRVAEETIEFTLPSVLKGRS
ncbi:4-hydroxy-3-methylbut-2-enyl diphosphate reductase [Longispora albida]|uniref:4-hydroxy-3-methylbut-2-enyl diphosphate reductase n=1 Tax=Longispora albida TaxID=203523 RepID=UPI00036BAD69|nr:4-hydroxy-3-methylbut-2-enyl diphosphate reductase [Longispora albida]